MKFGILSSMLLKPDYVKATTKSFLYDYLHFGGEGDRR